MIDKKFLENILKDINKTIIAMDIDGYTYAGVVGYALKIPAKKYHKQKFNKICTKVDEINEYIKQNNLDIKIEKFEELDNQSIVYGVEQVHSLGYKQYEHRIKYLENLKDIIKQLILLKSGD